MGNLLHSLRNKLKTGMDFRLLKAEASGPIMAVHCALDCRGLNEFLVQVAAESTRSDIVRTHENAGR